GEGTSWTKRIAETARARFGHDAPDLADLVRWADKIGAARFDSADEAISTENPVMRLVGVIEQHGDDKFLAKHVPALLERPLGEVAASPDVEELHRPLAKKRDSFVRRVRDHGERLGRVVLVDLTGGRTD